MECWALGLMAIRQARLEPLALSVTGHERVANGCAAASGEEKFDSPEAIARFGDILSYGGADRRDRAPFAQGGSLFQDAQSGEESTDL